VTEQTPTFVMAVPWFPARAAMAARLRRAIDAQIIWDTTHNINDTFRAALAAAGDAGAIFLEEDAHPVVDWRAKVEARIAQRPDEVQQFYTCGFMIGPRKRPGRMPGESFVANVCFYLPPGGARSLLDFSVGWEHKHASDGLAKAADITVAHWLVAHGWDYWLSAPSLVQHSDGVSMVDYRRPRIRRTRYLDGELAQL